MSGGKVKKVAVLMGGVSSEKEISISTGKGVSKALNKLNYHVKEIIVTRDLSKLIRDLNAFSPDVVFNALHGKFGEDGGVQGILNFLHIPYTHSGVLSSSIGMDKEMTRTLAKQYEIPVAPGGIKTRKEFLKMKLPLVVKPNNEGSSVGVQLILKERDRKNILQNWKDGQRFLVEKYIEGRELSVAVLDGEALGTVELKVKKGWYDYKNKYTPKAVKHIVPAPLSKTLEQKLCSYAQKIHLILGCRGVTRSDFRVTKKGHIYFLEINTNPGMTPTSLVPDIAQLKKLTYLDIVDCLVKGAQYDS